MTRKVNIMTNVVKGDQVKDSYGKIYDVIEVHEHNVMVLAVGFCQPHFYCTKTPRRYSLRGVFLWAE